MMCVHVERRRLIYARACALLPPTPPSLLPYLPALPLSLPIPHHPNLFVLLQRPCRKASPHATSSPPSPRASPQPPPHQPDLPSSFTLYSARIIRSLQQLQRAHCPSICPRPSNAPPLNGHQPHHFLPFFSTLLSAPPHPTPLSALSHTEKAELMLFSVLPNEDHPGEKEKKARHAISGGDQGLGIRV